MKAKTNILKLDNNAIHLNASTKLRYSSTNLPKDYFQFIPERPIYFGVAQINYDKNSGALTVRVDNYSADGLGETIEPDPDRPIHRIEFEKMDWAKFNPLIYSYTLSRIKHCFFNAGDGLYNALSQNKNRNIGNTRLKSANPNSQESRPSIIENIQTSVKVKFEEATFYDGGISFKARIREHDLVREFPIENQHLKKEFENVKPWFVKKIGKAFNVVVSLKLVDGQMHELTTLSDDICKIDQELIDSIKVHRVLMLAKTTRKENDGKSVFNNDEIFGILEGGNNDSNIFGSSSSNILEILIENGLAKNIKQLEYLSRDKQSLNEKLRFTLKPHFGFLFKVETSAKQFFIWELLNSHATYIWAIDLKDKDLSLFIEEQISLIKENGREKYRRYFKNLQLKDFEFHPIDHENLDLTEEERFQAWKKKVDDITTFHSQ